ncbi:hypothetical protein [Thalassolituus marinus]|uniref:Uncharacterized protein n=1 Tax=Thalassolituus marinus TaxID=671053 RepID=A0ABS7ZNZ7_9GAMM|nr:hypothetical protein [Thalassolituus marinus]MCA6063411.1 hypothetical protein [Thalassolituus marinus]
MTEQIQSIELRSALSGFESSAMNFGVRFIPDARVRAEYNAKAKQLSTEILREVSSGEISAAEGARKASEMRNLLMDALRGKTSEIAQAYAVRQKAVGKTLQELEEKYAKRMFGKSFQSLSDSQKIKIWRELVFASGRPQLKANKLAKTLGVAGKGFIAFTLTVAVYNIATAEDKAQATAKEGAVVGGGLLGSVAGGAAAGLACGPGAPVCVGIGIFVGGVMFAIGAEIVFDSFWS